MLNMGKNEPLAVAVTQAIHRGDVDGLNRLLGENPGLTTARINDRFLMHVATDWPGHFPNIAAVKSAPNLDQLSPNPVQFEAGDKLIELHTVFLLIRK